MRVHVVFIVLAYTISNRRSFRYAQALTENQQVLHIPWYLVYTAVQHCTWVILLALWSMTVPLTVFFMYIKPRNRSSKYTLAQNTVFESHTLDLRNNIYVSPRDTCTWYYVCLSSAASSVPRQCSCIFASFWFERACFGQVFTVQHDSIYITW